MRLPLVALTLMALSSFGASAQDRGGSPDVSECDRLAASPSDEGRSSEVPGVPSEKIDATRAIPACEAALKANPNDPRVMFQLGRSYNAGHDYDGAVRQYLAAVAKNFALAAVNLGVLYQHGLGVTKDETEAVRLFRIAAAQETPTGQFNLAVEYEMGRGGVTKDDIAARRLYQLAAAKGLAGAENALGLFYESGRGQLHKDDNEAARLFKLAAEQGLAVSQYNLARFIESGRGGTRKDDVEALRLYRLAADQNHAAAQNSVAVFMQSGRGGVPRDDVEAARLYKLAADKGLPAAQNNLGNFYQAGRGGLSKDDGEALRLYKLAAEKNNPFAQTNIGRFYETARGGLNKDESEAARYYKMAADQGHSYGQFNLGRFTEAGRGGLKKDNEEAARLYKLAADQGNTDAQKALQQLNARLAQKLPSASATPANSPTSTNSSNPGLAAPTAKPGSTTSANPKMVLERRVALVIGNSAYQSVPMLPNPRNDAKGVATALRSIGFTKVQVVSDASRSDLIAALRDFQHEVDNADWAAVYYAGHGLEVDGVNYLIPVDARLRDDRDVQDEAISVGRVLDATANARKLRIVMLDACRDNPFLSKMHRSIATRSVSRGLAAVEPVGATLVVFAAKDGETAEDGSGDHSPFTGSLIRRMQEPGVEINRLFRLVTGDVLKATANKQRPFVYGSLPGEDEYYFKLN
jgi:TPR repeat protein